MLHNFHIFCSVVHFISVHPNRIICPDFWIGYYLLSNWMHKTIKLKKMYSYWDLINSKERTVKSKTVTVQPVREAPALKIISQQNINLKLAEYYIKISLCTIEYLYEKNVQLTLHI